MMNKLVRYVVLIWILAGGVASFLWVSPDVSKQLTVGVVTTVAYVCWGLIHHAWEHDLHKKIVIEYVLMGIIAIILLITVLGF